MCKVALFPFNTDGLLMSGDLAQLSGLSLLLEGLTEVVDVTVV